MRKKGEELGQGTNGGAGRIGTDKGRYFDPAGEHFLFMELQTGFNFAQIALSAYPHETEKIARNKKNARKAYDVVLRFRDRVSFPDQKMQEWNAALNKLEAALRALGEAV